MEESWYILHTKPNAEKTITRLLTQKKIPNYCPLNTGINGRNKTKTVWQPLFKNYVFVRVSPDKLSRLCGFRGVLGVIYWQDQPARVTEEEIVVIQEQLKTYRRLELEKVAIGVRGVVTLTGELSVEPRGRLVCSGQNKSKTILPTLGYALIAAYEERRFKGQENAIDVNIIDRYPATG